MRGLPIIPYNTKIDFVNLRYFSYTIAVSIMLISISLVFFKGFNLGIDFKGGIAIEIKTDQSIKVSHLRSTLNKLALGDIKIQNFGSKGVFLIRVESQEEGTEANALAVEKIKIALAKEFNFPIDYQKIETVGAKVSDYLIENGLWALAFAIIGMLIYIWTRFEWEYSVCGIVPLLHNVTAVLGFYSLSNFEFNESAFAALLTVIGYSINDTVVVYDRLRENIKRYKKHSIKELINLSINQTLSRTILTSTTTVLALIALYVWGGYVIENFCMPIIVGIVVGTFTSIFIAVNLLLFFNIDKKNEEEIAPYGPTSKN